MVVVVGDTTLGIGKKRIRRWAICVLGVEFR